MSKDKKIKIHESDDHRIEKEDSLLCACPRVYKSLNGELCIRQLQQLPLYHYAITELVLPWNMIGGKSWKNVVIKGFILKRKGCAPPENGRYADFFGISECVEKYCKISFF